ncbi:MAG: CoA transferase, partial [Myxococcales bacterium]|nr:CoA transferase [Myxococcales bacterium]
QAYFGAAREALTLIASKISAYEFFEGAQRRNMPVGIIYSPEEVMSDPHFVARGFPVEVEHPELGRSVRYPGAPWIFHGSPWQLHSRAPRVGEHNEAAFDALGLSPARREELRERGVV